MTNYKVDLAEQSQRTFWMMSGFGCPKKASTSVLQKMATKHFIGDTVHSDLFYD